MMLYDCSICGQKDVETCDCEVCFWGADTKKEDVYKSGKTEGFWLGLGIGFLVSGLLFYIMEYFVG